VGVGWGGAGRKSGVGSGVGKWGGVGSGMGKEQNLIVLVDACLVMPQAWSDGQTGPERMGWGGGGVGRQRGGWVGQREQ